MNKFGTVALAIVMIVILFGCVLASTLVGTYNSLASGKQTVEKQWGQVENAYQRRFDLIPNLVSAVKGNLAQEQKVFGDIAEARTRYSGAGTVSEKAAAASELEGALSRLLVIVENYPQLTSQQSIHDLMIELEGSENRINFQRDKYNEDVEVYNRKVVTFPSNFIAGMFGFEKFEYFKSESGAEKAPSVDLGQ